MKQNNKIEKQIIGLILVLIMGWYTSKTIHTENKEGVVLSKCVDGDTAHFLVDGTLEKARFLAIDAPELKGNQPYAYEAKAFVCDALKSADKIELEFDPASNKRDKYDRILVWVYVDGELLQESVIEEGLAKVHYIYGDYRYVDALRATESKAKSNKKGIWK